MKRFAINTIIALALGLGLTLALLGLLGGTLPIIQARGPDNPAVASDAGRPSAAFGVPLAEREGREPLVSPELETATRERVNQALFNLPLRFIANAGQADPAVRFTVKGAGHTIFFTEDEVVFSAVSSGGWWLGAGGWRLGAGGWVPSYGLRDGLGLTSNSELRTRNSELGTQNSSTVRLRFLGANLHPTVEGLSPMSGVANFFLGNDPARWQVNVPTYGAVAYRDLYPGVDLVYRGTEGYLKSEFLLAPGADPAAIQMVYSGVEGMHLREDGALVLETVLGELIEEAPLIYQEADGVRQEIPGGYVVLSPGVDLTGLQNLSGLGSYRVGFQVGTYDPAWPLVIDPMLSYASYLGGGGDDHGQGIAVDSRGDVYVMGYTFSIDFPTHNAIDTVLGGERDVFVTQIISADGVYTYGYSTYLGGSERDIGWEIAVPPGGVGEVYIAGWTNSSDFPTRNAVQATLGGFEDAFVTQLISAGEVYTLGYSTYLGGGWDDYVGDIAVDGDGNAYVTGSTASTDFPTHNAIDTSLGGNGDAFVTQIISTGEVYTYGYSTYLGGSDNSDLGYGIAVDSVGNAYVAGRTYSTDFPIRNAIQPNHGGFGDVFVTQIISAGGVYTYGYSTYLGGGGDDYIEGGIAVSSDGAADVYVTGWTSSADFPIHNAIQASYGGGFYDAFVTRIISVGGVYTYGYSSYLGGGGNDYGADVAVDGDGVVYLTGGTSSSDFPTRNVIQSSHGGGILDAFVTQIISVGGVYTYGYSTYLGGSGNDAGCSIALDDVGNVYVTGSTSSKDFTIRNAIQPSHGGGEYDAFVARISGDVDLALRKTVTPGIVAPGGAITYTLVYTNQGGATAIGVLITDVVPISLTNAGFTSSGPQITPTGGISYTWQIAPLAPGVGGIITLTGIISPSVSDTFILTNQATIVTTDTYYVDTNPDNNVSVVHSYVGGYSIHLPVVLRQSPVGGR